MSEKDRVVCPHCGTTLDDFKRTSLVGCANCYLAFRDEILGTVRIMQGKTVHVGKRPAEGAEGKHDLMLEMERLKDAIEEALKQKDFETAERKSTILKEYSAIRRNEEDDK